MEKHWDLCIMRIIIIIIIIIKSFSGTKRDAIQTTFK